MRPFLLMRYRAAGNLFFQIHIHRLDAGSSQCLQCSGRIGKAEDHDSIIFSAESECVHVFHIEVIAVDHRQDFRQAAGTVCHRQRKPAKQLTAADVPVETQNRWFESI